MEPVIFCNLCQKAPAVGILSGYFEGVEDEPTDLMTCTQCAKDALARQ